jgi:alpha-tubulin suppressor-like RCC1 family protein
VKGGSTSHATLFDIYQLHANPDSMVVISGKIIQQTLDYPVPTIVRELLGLAIQSVSCGWQHVCVLTSTGQLCSWGKGKHGMLGHGDSQDQLQHLLSIRI